MLAIPLFIASAVPWQPEGPANPRRAAWGLGQVDLPGRAPAQYQHIHFLPISFCSLLPLSSQWQSSFCQSWLPFKPFSFKDLQEENNCVKRVLAIKCLWRFWAVNTERWQKCFSRTSLWAQSSLSQHDCIWAGLQSTAVRGEGWAKPPVSEGVLHRCMAPTLSASQSSPQPTLCSEWCYPFSQLRKLAAERYSNANVNKLRCGGETPAQFFWLQSSPSQCCIWWFSHQYKGLVSGGCGEVARGAWKELVASVEGKLSSSPWVAITSTHRLSSLNNRWLLLTELEAGSQVSEFPLVGDSPLPGLLSSCWVSSCGRGWNLSCLSW